MTSHTTPQYEVYAIRYATHAQRRSTENFLFHELHDIPMPLDFYLWVIKGGNRTIVVDTGFDRETAERRGRHILHDPGIALANIGVDTSIVDDVIVTHMHYDHAGNFGLFRRARFHVQDSEMGFCTGRCMCHDILRKPFEVENVVTAIRYLYAGRLLLTDGVKEIAPGITVHLVGGHSGGLQIVRVSTARGWLVLASDATHYWSNIRNRNPFPIVVDVPRMLEGYRTIETLADGADHVIPGHDPAVISRFPNVPGYPDIVRLHEHPRD